MLRIFTCKSLIPRSTPPVSQSFQKFSDRQASLRGVVRLYGVQRTGSYPDFKPPEYAAFGLSWQKVLRGYGLDRAPLHLKCPKI